MLNLMTFGLGATKFAVPALQGKTISDFYTGHTHIADKFFIDRNLGLDHAQCRAIHANIAQYRIGRGLDKLGGMQTKTLVAAHPNQQLQQLFHSSGGNMVIIVCQYFYIYADLLQ